MMIHHRPATRRSLLLKAGGVLTAALLVPALHAQDAATELAGPDAVPSRLASDEEDKPELLGVDLQNGIDQWKGGIKERIGLDFGIDYNSLGFAATDSIGDNTSASGVFRVFGTWELFNRGRKNNGSFIFKVENRHAYTDVAPKDFGGEIGYAGTPTTTFSDQGWRVTHLFWQQRFAEGRGVSYIGFLDITDYTDVYALASPWTTFSNLAFQNGSGTIGGLPDGALGAMVGGFVTENLYLVGSLVDANGDATDLAGGFDTFFNDFETFKTFEFGWTTKQEEFFLNNAHVTLWQIDERSLAGTPDGWGISASITAAMDNGFTPFLRGGWAKDGGSLYEGSVSAGFGYTRNPGQSMLGLGLNWNRPNESTYDADLGDQYSLELFQLLQLTEGIAITPSVQIINNPALNPTDNWSTFFGLRVRVAL